MMQQEQWIADRAMLQRLMQLHPEWTQQELADWIGRSVEWVKKWRKRFREAPPGDAGVLFGKPLGRKTPYPQTDPEVEERILAIRDAPPENLKRTPGPRAILYYLPRDPQLQHRCQALPRSTRTIKNAFVERYHRTYNQECLQVSHPQTLEQAREITEAFLLHYNTERPNQALLWQPTTASGFPRSAASARASHRR
jgi:Integrase core domain